MIQMLLNQLLKTGAQCNARNRFLGSAGFMSLLDRKILSMTPGAVSLGVPSQHPPPAAARCQGVGWCNFAQAIAIIATGLRGCIPALDSVSRAVIDPKVVPAGICYGMPAIGRRAVVDVARRIKQCDGSRCLLIRGNEQVH